LVSTKLLVDPESRYFKKGEKTMVAARKVCRFCNRKIPVTKYVRHACKDKKIARDWYAEYRARVLADGTPDMLMVLEKYPTFHAWDLAIVMGEISYPDYPYSPISVESSSTEQSDMDDGEDTTEASEEEPEGGLLVHPERQSEGGFGEPRIDDSKGLRPSDRKEEGLIKRPTLKSTAEHVAAKFIDMKDEVKVRISSKEKGWLPIVSIQHGLQMAIFKAKQRGTKFALTREQKKILAHSCYATFGESPLSKLKVTGEGEYDVHIAVTAIEVYGEFWAENYEGLIETGAGIWKRIKKVKKKVENDVQTERQEDQ